MGYLAYLVVPFLFVVYWLIFQCDWSYINGDFLIGCMLAGLVPLFVLVVLGIGAAIHGSGKLIKKLVTTDYSPVKDKREKVLEELMKEGDVDRDFIPEKETT